jgi:hypothetical protein
MKLSNNIFIFFASLLLIAGCSKVLDKSDLSALTPDQVYNDSILARTYIDYIYEQNLPPWGGTAGLAANLSEETSGDTKYFEGTLVANDVADFGTANNANSNYGKIRAINTFISNVDKGTLSTSWKNTLKGQALFFRAWRYFELVKLYGGVPLILEPLEAVGVEAKEAAFFPRNKTSEVIAQIATDLNMSADLLPGKWTTNLEVNWGRITKGAALALKSRALLYYASPQFNPTDKAERWQAVYDAAKAAKTTLTANGFGLNASFENMWFQERNNPEAVFITGYNNSSSDQPRKNNGYDNSTRPAFAGTSGGSNQPTKQLVDAFPMKDGKKIGESTRYPYDSQLYYKNRDPRFDKTIAYNGSTWTLNGVPYRFWTYLEGTTATPLLPPPTPAIRVTTTTGFYLRKAIDPAVAAGNAQYSGTDWMEIRFTEVLLNLAEAAAGVNKLDEAYTELKAIRARAGIEAGTDGLYGLKAGMSRKEMIEAVLYERQIELAFEGKRYWDMRRHKLFETVLNGTRRTGVTITFKPSPTMTAAQFQLQRDAMNLDDAYKNYFTIASKILDTRYAINWKPEYYFFALPLAAIDNNPKLEQTKGWNGTFDPLQ